MNNEYEKVKQEVVNILRNEMGQTVELVYKDRGGKMVQEVRITGEPPVVLSVGVDALIDMGIPQLISQGANDFSHLGGMAFSFRLLLKKYKRLGLEHCTYI